MERYRHSKGGTYTLLARDRPLQANAYLGEGAMVAIYQGEDGQLWVRWQEDFDDGRFVRLPDTTPTRACDDDGPERTMDDLVRAGTKLLNKWEGWEDVPDEVERALAAFERVWLKAEAELALRTASSPLRGVPAERGMDPPSAEDDEGYSRRFHKLLADQSITAPATASGADGALVAYLTKQWAWSKETFGPALPTSNILAHIRKEMIEVEAKPHDLSEWIDVALLALDGFWRHGGKPEDLLPLMQAKQDKNFARTWPDWRTVREGEAINHDRSGEAAPAEAGGELR